MCGFAGDLRRIRADAARALILGHREFKVVSQACQVGKRRRRILLVYRNDERFVDAENGVGIDVVVAGNIERRDQLAVSGSADHEMNVSRPEAVAFLGADHIADRSVHRDHVAEGTESAEIVAAVRVGTEASTQVHLRGVVQLQIVVTVSSGSQIWISAFGIPLPAEFTTCP